MSSNGLKKERREFLEVIQKLYKNYCMVYTNNDLKNNYVVITLFVRAFAIASHH